MRELFPLSFGESLAKNLQKGGETFIVYFQSFEGVKRALFQKCTSCVGSGAKLLTFCVLFSKSVEQNDVAIEDVL